MQVKVITEIDSEFEKKWEKFVLDHPNGNFFQSPAAYEFFRSVDDYQPVLLTAEEENIIKGVLSAVIITEHGIKGYFSRRCIVWGGPIANSDELAGLLIDELDTYLKSKIIYTEFRNLFDLSDLNDYFIKSGYELEDRINYIVEIETVEANKKKLNENRRRQINKSLKSGVEIVSPKELNEVKEFYSILKILYIERVKKPLPDFCFFEQFFLIPDVGKYFLIKFDGKIIGGIMCPVFKDTIYEWYVCGLDTEYKDQSPSVMATWAAIAYGINNGLKYFDFMGAGKPEEDYGVREFKSKFGGELVQYGRFLRVNNKLLYNVGKLGLKFMRLLK